MRNMRNMLNVLIELDKYGMTNKELAEKLGVNRDTVSNWWGGTSCCSKQFEICLLVISTSTEGE